VKCLPIQHWGGPRLRLCLRKTTRSYHHHQWQLLICSRVDDVAKPGDWMKVGTLFCSSAAVWSVVCCGMLWLWQILPSRLCPYVTAMHELITAVLLFRLHCIWGAVYRTVILEFFLLFGMTIITVILYFCDIPLHVFCSMYINAETIFGWF